MIKDIYLWVIYLPPWNLRLDRRAISLSGYLTMFGWEMCAGGYLWEGKTLSVSTFRIVLHIILHKHDLYVSWLQCLLQKRKESRECLSYRINKTKNAIVFEDKMHLTFVEMRTRDSPDTWNPD